MNNDVPYFPATSSILSALEVEKIIKGKYRLSKKISCQLLKTWINDTYLIIDGLEQYIFRIYHYNWRSKTAIQEEVNLLNHLKDTISVSFPIQDLDGDFIQTFNAIEGERYGVLFSFAEGEKMPSLSANQHADVGRFMANFHTETIGYQLNRFDYNLNTLVTLPSTRINNFLKSASDEKHYLERLQNHLAEEFNKIEKVNLRKGVVHLDIWSDNLHINSQDKITLFDFDFCGKGWLVLDIAYHTMMLFAFTPDETLYFEKRARFIEGYESVTAISDEEKALIPVLGASLYFFYLGVQCERFYAIFVNENYVRNFINSRIKKWWEFHKKNVS